MPDEAVNHHDHDKIVELARMGNRVEADVLIAKLEANGISAMARYGGFGSMVPYAIVDGNSIFVFDCDLERALAVINSHDDPDFEIPD